MKALIFGVSALVLNGFLSIQAIAHPPAYGPDGLIPHSHTGDGTTITGSAVIASHNDCPEATLPAILGVQTEGPCIRVNHGRPISHHVSAPDHEPVLIPTSRPFVRQVQAAQPVLQPAARRVVVAVPATYRMPIYQHAPLPIIQVPPRRIISVVPAAPRVIKVNQPTATPTPRILIQGTGAAVAFGPELVTKFHYEGELLSVINTHTTGLFGMILVKVVNERGVEQSSWWTSRGQCFTRGAFLAQSCWSSAGYHERFEQELSRTHRVISGPGRKRSTDPCDHYTKLEAILSRDTSGACGY